MYHDPGQVGTGLGSESKRTTSWEGSPVGSIGGAGRAFSNERIPFCPVLIYLGCLFGGVTGVGCHLVLLLLVQIGS